MTLEEIWLGGRTVNVTGSGYRSEGGFNDGDHREEVRGDLELFLKTGALASNAAINKNESGQWDVVGDPVTFCLNMQKYSLTCFAYCFRHILV